MKIAASLYIKQKKGGNTEIESITGTKINKRRRGYETHSLYMAIRETAMGPAGRSHIFLVFLRNREEFEGYFLNPYVGNKKMDFHGINAFLEEADALVKRVAGKDAHGDMVNCCSRWIEDGTPDYADFALYLVEASNKKWEGRFFIPDKNEEREFCRKEELKVLLQDFSEQG